MAPLAVTGAVVVIVAVAAHTASLLAMARTKTLLAGILRVVAWYYAAARAALALGAGLGGALPGGATARSAPLGTDVMLAHAHLNMLGWLGLPIVGTGFMLWPTVLRTRMSPAAPRTARRQASRTRAAPRLRRITWASVARRPTASAAARRPMFHLASAPTPMLVPITSHQRGS